MKTFLLFLLFSTSVFANDYGDKDCNIYVSYAANEITGGYGNFLNAEVVVKKELISKDFNNSKVRILGYEDIAPTFVQQRGNNVVFSFKRYAKGIVYHGNSATIVAYIDNGMDRLFDNNDNVVLVQRFNWYYTNPRCK